MHISSQTHIINFVISTEIFVLQLNLSIERGEVSFALEVYKPNYERYNVIMRYTDLSCFAASYYYETYNTSQTILQT